MKKETNNLITKKIIAFLVTLIKNYMARPIVKLSPRFKTFVSNVIPNEPFWDLCCDHGYVGLEVFLSKKSSEVHLVDQVPHIMKKIEIYLTENEILSCGVFLHTTKAEKLALPLSGTVLIAGVGGKSIQIILNELLKQNLLHAKRLLLSPHTDLKAFNEILESDQFRSQYDLTEKVSLDEGGVIKTLFIFDKSTSLR